MATNLQIDDALLAEAQRLGGFKTKRQTVNEALQQFVQHKKQLEILELKGQIEYDEDIDHGNQHLVQKRAS